MSREIKNEHFFCMRADARWYYHELRRNSLLYKLIKFTFLGDGETMCYYLVTTRTLMSVVYESRDYLSMLADYSIDRLGYEPVDRGCFLSAIELIEA